VARNNDLYTYSFKVNRSSELLAFLLSRVKLSRNGVKSLLSGRKVLVNGKVVRQFDYPLAKDDEVKIAKKAINEPLIKKAKRGQSNNPLFKQIIYEDDYFLAINKPAGLLSVQSDKERESAYFYALDYIREKDKRARLYILHRIDKETSGVLVFCKDIKLHSKLKMHWNEDVKLREYYCLCEGKLNEKQGTLVNYLKENTNNLVYVSNDKRGKKAITNYEVIAQSKNKSLLRVWIDTGRKNQIRVQLAHLGHPILGDDKYGDSESFKRLALHASALHFINPETKQLIRLKAALPKEFQI